MAVDPTKSAIPGSVPAWQSDDNVEINSLVDNKTIRLTSRNYSQATGSSIGYQSKPAQTITSTGSVIGGEVSPRVNNGVALANIIGLHVDAYLKGTSAGAISGDVRGMQIELVSDDAGTRVLSGDVTGLRFRMALSATSVGGVISAIKIEKAEAQTNSQQWEYVLDLTGVNGLIWDDDFTNEPGTAAGGFKVRINGSDRWVQTYSSAPS